VPKLASSAAKRSLGSRRPFARPRRLSLRPGAAQHSVQREDDAGALGSSAQEPAKIACVDWGGAGLVYTTFHRPDIQANVITTYSDWATNCPKYKVTPVLVSPSNGPSRWQEDHEKFSRQSRRIASVEAAE
jgi:formate dehydrogenase major subunit